MEKSYSIPTICRVIGFNPNDLHWRIPEKKNICETTGIIIEYQSLFYVLTTRENLITCESISMYYESDSFIKKNSLYILFQSIETNIIILGTTGSSSFVFDQSEKICKNEFSQIKSFDINFGINFDINSKYYLLQLQIKEKFNVPYKISQKSTSIICESPIKYTQSFLPKLYNHQFVLKNHADKLFGMNSAPVLLENKLIGIVNLVKNNKLTIEVTPLRIIEKVLKDFVQNKATGIYSGFLTLPFDYYIDQVVLVYSSTIMFGPSGQTKIKKNTRIISINDSELKVFENSIFIKDEKSNQMLDLDTYIYLVPTKTVKLSLEKFDVNIYLGPIPPIPFRLTSIPYFFPPKYLFPIIQINNIIITELTHELLNYTFSNKITLTNSLINKYIQCGLSESIVNDKNFSQRIFIIIDTIDTIGKNSTRFPHLKINKKQDVHVPIIKTINGKPIESFPFPLESKIISPHIKLTFLNEDDYICD